MNTNYDTEFSKVNNLNWLPWVGENYDESKVLILGDSHYDDNDGWLEFKNATREFVKNQGLNSDNPDYQRRKFFSQIEKIIFNKQISYEERNKFWSSVSFLNLVQRLLPSREERPKEIDFDNSWESFLNVASILKPDTCIKLGIDGVGRLGYYLNTAETEWKRDNVQEFFTKPYSINLTNNDHKMKIIFINHPTGSFGFNSEEWTKFIEKEFPKLRSLIAKN